MSNATLKRSQRHFPHMLYFFIKKLSKVSFSTKRCSGKTNKHILEMQNCIEEHCKDRNSSTPGESMPLVNLGGPWIDKKTFDQ